jgi:trans-2,3-dihydro-3-hydroxyanthranilate isomerase
MQTIAKEFDYPETTFVMPPNDPAHARRVRIFKLRAGAAVRRSTQRSRHRHAHWVMSNSCAAGDFVLEEGVGPSPFHKAGRRGVSARLRIEREPEVPDTVPRRTDMAAVCLCCRAISSDVFCAPPEWARGSRSLSVVRRGCRSLPARPPYWRRMFRGSAGARKFRPFAGEITLTDPNSTVDMFAPALGSPRGSCDRAAAAADRRHRCSHRGHGRSEQVWLDIVQGVAMGSRAILIGLCRT